MSVPQQHRPGTKTLNQKQPQLRGADVAAAFVAPLGGARKNELVVCADEATFWKTFLPAITVEGQEVPLGPDALPLPATLARHLAERPGGKLRAYRDLLKWLAEGGGSTDRDVLALAQGLN